MTTGLLSITPSWTYMNPSNLLLSIPDIQVINTDTPLLESLAIYKNQPPPLSWPWVWHHQIKLSHRHQDICRQPLSRNFISVAPRETTQHRSFFMPRYPRGVTLLAWRQSQDPIGNTSLHLAKSPIKRLIKYGALISDRFGFNPIQ